MSDNWGQPGINQILRDKDAEIDRLLAENAELREALSILMKQPIMNPLNAVTYGQRMSKKEGE